MSEDDSLPSTPEAPAGERFRHGSVPIATDDQKRLSAVIAKGAEALPPGHYVMVTSGTAERPQTPGSEHPGGHALDVQIIGPDGAIPNRGADTTGLYRKLAVSAYLANQQMFPGTNFTWGGRFETQRGSGAADLMHFDTAKDRGHLLPSLAEMATAAGAAPHAGPPPVAAVPAAVGPPQAAAPDVPVPMFGADTGRLARALEPTAPIAPAPAALATMHAIIPAAPQAAAPPLPDLHADYRNALAKILNGRGLEGVFG